MSLSDRVPMLKCHIYELKCARGDDKKCEKWNIRFTQMSKISFNNVTMLNATTLREWISSTLGKPIIFVFPIIHLPFMFC